jgi:hypothetical protein
VQAAAEKTGSAYSLRVTLSIEYADDSSSTTQGEMKGLDVRIATDHTAADGSVWQERIVVVGDQMWEGSSAPVTIGPDERLTLFSEACEAVLGAALQAQEVETVGTEDIRGSEATHYSIALDEASRAALEKLSPSHLAWFEPEYPSEVMSIDVWVADGLVHRMVVDGELGTATADYHDFNADITITPPAGSRAPDTELSPRREASCRNTVREGPAHRAGPSRLSGTERSLRSPLAVPYLYNA